MHILISSLTAADQKNLVSLCTYFTMALKGMAQKGTHQSINHYFFIAGCCLNDMKLTENIPQQPILSNGQEVKCLEEKTLRSCFIVAITKLSSMFETGVTQVLSGFCQIVESNATSNTPLKHFKPGCHWPWPQGYAYPYDRAL